MDTEFGNFFAFFWMVILPYAIILWAIGRRFNGHDEEIMELKKRINKLENQKD